MTWTLFHGDAEAGLGLIHTEPERTVIITDPPWPNAPAGMFPGVEPYATLARVAECFPAKARRVVVHLGCNSDPRILSGIPKSLPFVRTCWLRYARPSYAGTVLNSGDVAYVFGSREATDGRSIMPGEVCMTDTSDMLKGEHPCPRSLESVAWLVKWFTRAGDTVLDPFAGSGTTGVAALRAGRSFIGMEADATWAALARSRLEAEADGQSLQHARSGQIPMFTGGAA